MELLKIIIRKISVVPTLLKIMNTLLFNFSFNFVRRLNFHARDIESSGGLKEGIIGIWQT